MKFLPTLAIHLRYALVLIVVIIILVLLSKWSAASNNPTIVKLSRAVGAKNDLATTTPTPAHVAAAASLAREANSWFVKATRTNDPHTALIYSTYALGYIDAALDLVQQNTATLQTALPFDVAAMHSSLKEQQQQLVDVDTYRV